MSEPKRRGPLKQFPLTTNLRFAEKDRKRLAQLAERWRCSRSAAMRKALEMAAQAEGLPPDPR